MRGSTLAATARAFARHPTPWVLGGEVAGFGALRLVVGPPYRWRELVLVAAIVAAQPFVEWVIHVFLLHFKPRTIRGRTFDPSIARSHRAHHLDPKDLSLVFVQVRWLLALAPVVAALFFGLAPDVGEALTGMTTVSTLTLTYEWTHYLIHTDYVPRHAPYRLLWRTHRLHHFRNERYWFGVTNPLGDLVLRTYPKRDAVPASSTARTLGVTVA